VGGFTADVGLIVYGLVEIFGAALIASNYSVGEAAELAALPNAIAVQLVIAACWFSQSKAKE
jgi:hypothetical protein